MRGVTGVYVGCMCAQDFQAWDSRFLPLLAW